MVVERVFERIEEGTAAARFPSALDAVRRRFIKHALEEFGHDQMALRDFCAYRRRIGRRPGSSRAPKRPW